MAFDEVRLPANIDRGAQGGPQFASTVIVVASGAEQRIAQWSRPRMRWTIGHSLRTPAQMSVLVAFFIARQGRLRGWRFKDWLDHSSEVGGVETRHLAEELTSTTFQLRKSYTSGGVTVYRNILKPVSDTLGDPAATDGNSTVRLYDAATAGSEITAGWTVSGASGVITFASPPGGSIYATFEYDIPARFDSDGMNLSLDEVTYSTWSGVEVVELLTS